MKRSTTYFNRAVLQLAEYWMLPCAAGSSFLLAQGSTPLPEFTNPDELVTLGAGDLPSPGLLS